jgi:outer membrane protein assembly factor BamB
MSRFGAFVILSVVAGLAGLAGCGGLPQGDWMVAVTSAELAEADLDYLWQNSVVLSRGEEVAAVWHLDENVYCLTTMSRVWVFNAVDGNFRWSAELGAAGSIIFAPAHADRVLLPPILGSRAVPEQNQTAKAYDLVIFNSVSTALVFERATGTQLTRLDFGRADFAANTSTVCDGVRVYAGSVNGRYVAMELVTGLAAWKGSTGAMISAKPAVMGAKLFLASHNGGIYAIQIGANEGAKLWPAFGQQQTDGAIVGDMAVNEQGIFAGSNDYNVYALDPTSGRVVWRFRCGRPVRDGVLVGATNVYALAKGDAFYAIDLVTGQRAKWKLPNGTMILSEVGNTAYVLNDAGGLMAVDAAIGTVKTVVPLTALDLFVPNTSTQAIFAGSRDGLICCLRPRGTR